MSTGTCFGYEVHSPLPLQFLRPGTGEPLTLVHDGVPQCEPDVEPIAVWEPDDEHPWPTRLYEQDARFNVWITPCLFDVDPAVPSISVPPSEELVRREERLWSLPALLCFSARGDVPFHAAAVEVDGGAVVFGAPGRFGKTTLATAFHCAGFRLLSEDLTCCRVGEQPVVFPGPAVVRVRRDVYSQLPITGARVVAEDHHRVHLALDDERRGSGDAVPLRGVILLRDAADECAMTRADPAASLRDLWALSLNLPTDDDRSRRFADLVELTTRVPLWNLHRPVRIDALDDTIDTIVRTVSS